MRSALSRILAIILLFATCHASTAQKLKSGPQPGESIPGPFHDLNINGPHAGNPHCLVCEFGLRPTVLVFVRGVLTDKSAATELVRKLDEALDRNKNVEL